MPDSREGPAQVALQAWLSVTCDLRALCRATGIISPATHPEVICGGEMAERTSVGCWSGASVELRLDYVSLLGAMYVLIL